MATEYYIIFLCDFAYYMLFRCTTAETIGGAILTGFVAVVASIVGLIGCRCMGEVLPSTSFVIDPGTAISWGVISLLNPMHLDAFAFVFYPVLFLGIITLMATTLKLISIDRDK